LNKKFRARVLSNLVGDCLPKRFKFPENFAEKIYERQFLSHFQKNIPTSDFSWIGNSRIRVKFCLAQAVDFMKFY